MFQHYSKEQKHQAILLHEQGYGSTVISRQTGISLSHIKRLLNRYRQYGISVLDKQPHIHSNVTFKESVVRYVLEKCLSCEQAALHFGVSNSAVYSWVQKVKTHGYASLSDIKLRGRPPKDMGRPKKKLPQTELEKLQEENLRLKAENALLKKVQALVEAKEAQQRGIGRKPSKN